MSERAASQLKVIDEITQLAIEQGIELWLEGGWAMDFFLGEVTRDHEDIDWFMWVKDGPTLSSVLIEHGFTPLAGAPIEQQLDFARDDVEVSFKLVTQDEGGSVVVGGGPWEGDAWPEGMLQGGEGQIGSIRSRYINPLAQVEMKKMMPIWIPQRRRRRKDLTDIARIEAELRRQEGAI